MMGAAENIADLRSLLSIVAEETGALKVEDADQDSVGWTTEGPLPMTFGHVRRAHSALAAIEAALSAAEPVSYQRKTVYGWREVDAADIPHYRSVGQEIRGLYAAPPAPSVAVKAKLISELREMAGSITYAAEPSRVMREAADALSAQVQDVARDLPADFEKWWDDAGHYVGGVVKMTYTQRKQLAWDAFYASANPAAPAKQEG